MAEQLMSRQEANLILDQVKIGILHPLHIINQALIVTGDLKP
jgi:hypothetical protein